MLAEESLAVEVDQAALRAAILSEWKQSRISGADAWDLFAQHNLWGDRTEAFHRYAVGAEAVSIQRDFWALKPPRRAAVQRLILSAKARCFLTARAADWLLDLFVAKEV